MALPGPFTKYRGCGEARRRRAEKRKKLEQVEKMRGKDEESFEGVPKWRTIGRRREGGILSEGGERERERESEQERV